MRFVGICVIVSILLVAVPGWPQQATSTSQLQPVPQDPQAVSIINQALAAAGGTAAIDAIKDYVGIGTITYHRPQDMQGSVTVRESGLNLLRIDALLPSGNRSQLEGKGKVMNKSEDGSIGRIHAQPPLHAGRVVLPMLLLSAASKGKAFSTQYIGVAQVSARPTYQIEVRKILPGPDQTGRLAEYLVFEFYIDTSSFQVVMMQDAVQDHLVRQIQYEDYKTVGAASVPFSIQEQVNGQPTWSMQLNQITFNSGLRDSDFTFSKQL